jgi:regulatory protein
MEHKVKKIKHSPEAAYLKIQNWCAYQERSQNETRYKLLDYGLSVEEADQIISKLIGDNFLNEERFAIALTGGKFRIKHWGKNKIKLELRKHKVSDYCINKALKSIDANDYEKTLKSQVEKKLSTLNYNDRKKQYYTTLKYLVSKGFESDLVTHYLNLTLDNT